MSRYTPPTLTKKRPCRTHLATPLSVSRGNFLAKRIVLHGGVAATLAPIAPHCSTKIQNALTRLRLENLILRPFGGLQEGGFPKGGFGRCSPVPKTGTRVRSHVPLELKLDRGYVGDKFGKSLEGSQAPPSFWEVPRLPRNLLMPLFLMGCFPVDFQDVKRPLRTKSVKRPIKVGKRPINEGKRPIEAKVLVGVSVGSLRGCFRARPPWRKTAPLKRPIKRSMRLPRKLPELPRKFFGDFPGSSLIVELNSNPGFPRKFPGHPRKFPKLPRKFPDFPGGQPVSLGSLTTSPDSQKLSLSAAAVSHVPPERKPEQGHIRQKPPLLRNRPFSCESWPAFFLSPETLPRFPAVSCDVPPAPQKKNTSCCKKVHFFCRKRHFSLGKCIFLSEKSFFCAVVLGAKES